MKKLLSLVFFLLLIATLILIAYVFRHPIAEAALDPLVIEDSRTESEIIFVMGGYPISRLPLAYELLQDGYGKKIWYPVSKSTQHDLDFVKTFGFLPDEEFVVREALSKRMPPDGYKILGESISSHEDLLLLKNALEETPASSVLIISSPFHMKRTEFLVRTLFPDTTSTSFHFAHIGKKEYLERQADPDDVPLAVLQEWIKYAVYRVRY